MKYFFPIHLDGDNRGCEAIAKGTSLLLDESSDHLLGLCRDIAIDTRLGIAKYISLIPAQRDSIFIRSIKKLVRLLHLPFNVNGKDSSIEFIKSMTTDDVLVSTGGDMMCYGDNQVNTTNNYAHDKGCKTILWGCSMGPENLTQEKERTLKKFSMIYARESLSYIFFKNLGLKNVCLFPDPAFILEPEFTELPQCFKTSKVIGINISNYILGGFSIDTPNGIEISRMIDYIINHTEFHILLIPHVLWAGQDDRVVSTIIKNKYKDTGRISILNSDKLNYCQIRYVISNCHLFIGARTHAVISAYSTRVPALALGYSIKSRGIAKDLGLSENLVVDCRNTLTNSILDSFKYLLQNENEIRGHLDQILPKYIESTYGIRKKIYELYE